MVGEANPYAIFKPKTAFGFVDDNFEKSVMDGRWKQLEFKTPAPVASLQSEGGQQSLGIATPDDVRYDINQAGVIQGLFVYQDIAAGEDFEIIAEMVYPDETFSATNSMYLGIALLFYYDPDNYVWLEAQCHPTVGARIRWGVNDDTSGASAGVDETPSTITIPVTPIYLKIKATGSSYGIYISEDDSSYELMATLTAANLAGLGNKIGIINETYISTEANAVGYEFYCRSIKEIYST